MCQMCQMEGALPQFATKIFVAAALMSPRLTDDDGSAPLVVSGIFAASCCHVCFLVARLDLLCEHVDELLRSHDLRVARL